MLGRSKVRELEVQQGWRGVHGSVSPKALEGTPAFMAAATSSSTHMTGEDQSLERFSPSGLASGSAKT